MCFRSGPAPCWSGSFRWDTEHGTASFTIKRPPRPTARCNFIIEPMATLIAPIDG